MSGTEEGRGTSPEGGSVVDSAVREQPQGLWGLGPPRGRFPWGSSSWALPIPCSACSRRAGPACWACRLLGPVAESAHASHQDPQLWGGGRRVPVLAGVHRLRGGTCRRRPKEPRGVLSPGPPLIPVAVRSSLRCTPLSLLSFIQFRPVAQSCPTLCDAMDCSRPGLPVHHQLPEFTQTHVH